MPFLWTQSWHCLFWDSCLQNKECLCHEPKQEKRGRKKFQEKMNKTYTFSDTWELRRYQEKKKKSLTEQGSYWKLLPSSLHLQNKLIRKFWFIYHQYKYQENSTSSANCLVGSSDRDLPKPSPVFLLHKRWCRERFWGSSYCFTILRKIFHFFSCWQNEDNRSRWTKIWRKIWIQAA